MTKKSKELKTSHIRKLAKDSKKQEVYEFEDGVTLKFYPIFADSMIDELLIELKEILNQANTKEGLELNDKTVYNLILLQCIKHFTHLGKDIKPSFEFQLDYLNALIDSGYFKKIINEVFLPEQINKVFERVSDIMSESQMIEKIIERTQEKVKQLELKNKDVLDKVGKKFV